MSLFRAVNCHSRCSVPLINCSAHKGWGIVPSITVPPRRGLVRRGGFGMGRGGTLAMIMENTDTYPFGRGIDAR
jgi:hypothetical protein